MSLSGKIITFGKVLWKTVGNFVNENPFGRAAELAFYTIFSMPGVLIVAVTVGGMVYDRDLVTGGIMDQISYLTGPESARQVESVLENAWNPGQTNAARWVGIGTLLFSATTVFVSLQGSLNHIWRIRPKPKRGYLKLIIDRVLSFAMVVSIGFMLLVTLILDALVVLLGSSIKDLTGVDVVMAGVINFMISAIVITAIFALLFKVLPDARVPWKDVMAGAVLSTALFMIGKYVIGFYIGNSSVGSAYGAAGSLVLLLVWVYYSSIIVLFGGEFTHVYSLEHGKKIKPSKHAVKIRTIEVESDG